MRGVLRPGVLALGVLGLLPLLGGCAALAEAQCRGEAERAGIYLGRQYLGESCTTTGGYRVGYRWYPPVTTCTPNWRDLWQWTPRSDYVYQLCLRNYEASQGRPVSPAVAPAVAPVEGKPPAK